jgi:hypothetical protein
MFWASAFWAVTPGVVLQMQDDAGLPEPAERQVLA